MITPWRNGAPRGEDPYRVRARIGKEPVYTKGQRQRYDNSVMTLALVILFSLKTMGSLQNGLAEWALKPRGDVTRSPKQGISGPTKRPMPSRIFHDSMKNSSGSSGRVSGGEKLKIYAAAFSGHLFHDLFSHGRGRGSWPPCPAWIRYWKSTYW